MKKALWLDSINKEKILNYKRLKGGVSSEVYKVTTNTKTYCIKRSLKKLMVKKKWIVNQNRIYFEYLWLYYCKQILQNNIPKTYHYNSLKKYIVMEYLDNTKFKTLKELYFKKNINLSTIKTISNHLYKIHNLSKNSNVKKIFSKNSRNFFNLRLDPYFNEVAKVYPHFKKKVNKINANYKKSSITLVHGDFSPKNILVGKNKIIYLDAECCNYGDPVFDLVFFSNHLLIKSIFISEKKELFLKAYKLFYKQYMRKLSKYEYKNYLKRILDMTPVMLLARVDGKSPVEYIKTKRIKNKIREMSFKMIDEKLLSLENVLDIFNDK